MYGHLFGLTAGLVFVLFFSPTPCVAKHDIHYGDVHTAMLQQSMKVLFGADEGRLARDRNNRLLPDPDEPARPPRYMMELYERYRDGLLQKENFGNTVRSIHASIGKCKKGERKAEWKSRAEMAIFLKNIFHIAIVKY